MCIAIYSNECIVMICYQPVSQTVLHLYFSEKNRYVIRDFLVAQLITVSRTTLHVTLIQHAVASCSDCSKVLQFSARSGLHQFGLAMFRYWLTLHAQEEHETSLFQSRLMQTRSGRKLYQKDSSLISRDSGSAIMK